LSPPEKNKGEPVGSSALARFFAAALFGIRWSRAFHRAGPRGRLRLAPQAKIPCEIKHFVLLLFLAVLAVSEAADTQQGGGKKAVEAAAQPELLRFEESLDAMGTTYTVVLYGTDRYKLAAAAEAAFDEARRLDRLLSNYRPDSEWSAVNKNAANEAVRVSQELFDLLAYCLDVSRRSEGAFDISVGPLMKVWGFYKGTGRLPHRAEVRGALTRVGWQNISLDAAARTVRFRRSGVEIDPGGIGKGYAVDRMASVLKESGVTSAMITAGGSSIYGLGTPPGEPRGWRVSLRHPRRPRESVQEVFLHNSSMSTSGSYEKFFRAEGRVYSHIMDPRTGFPAQGVLSASVLAPRTLDSEAWTKPMFILGRSWAARHKPQGFRVFLCEDRSELACAWVQ
jgi:thiamine biosynthesis lipoprotein